jgi:hypothetical protein
MASVQNVAVFEENWGLENRQVDAYCFLCTRSETKEDMNKNTYFCKLVELTRCQLAVSDFKRCRIIQKLYNYKFRSDIDNQNKSWSMRSIKRHIYEHDASPEVVSQLVGNVLVAQLRRITETCLGVKQADNGVKMVTIENMKEFLKLSKSFLDVTKSSKLQ